MPLARSAAASHLSSLQDRHVVITGASRGLGRALAIVCHEQGAKISVCARSTDAVQSLAHQTSAVAAALDVRDEEAVADWLHVATAQYGPIDVLVNNAAMLGPMTELVDYPLETFHEVVDVNIVGVFVVMRTALPKMKRPGGIILSLSSYLGRHGLPRYGAYCASKFAVEGLAQLVAEEHREEGIVSCTVDPGMVQTDMLKAALGTDDVSEHVPPRDAALAFVELIKSVDLDDSGHPLNLFPD